MIVLPLISAFLSQLLTTNNVIEWHKEASWIHRYLAFDQRRSSSSSSSWRLSPDSPALISSSSSSYPAPDIVDAFLRKLFHFNNADIDAADFRHSLTAPPTLFSQCRLSIRRHFRPIAAHVRAFDIPEALRRDLMIRINRAVKDKVHNS